MTTKPSKNDKAQGKEEAFTRKDYFRDLKKVAKKQDRPSQRAQEKR